MQKLVDQWKEPCFAAHNIAIACAPFLISFPGYDQNIRPSIQHLHLLSRAPDVLGLAAGLVQREDGHHVQDDVAEHEDQDGKVEKVAAAAAVDVEKARRVAHLGVEVGVGGEEVVKEEDHEGHYEAKAPREGRVGEELEVLRAL